MTLFESGPTGTPPRPSRSRARGWTGWLIAGSLVVAAAVVASLAVPALPQDDRERIADALPWVSAYLDPIPEPTPEVAALADSMGLTDEARDVFYRTQPELLGDEITDACDRPSQEGDRVVASGCYTSVSAGGTSRERIFLFEPADERLSGSVVTTAAHELLHAVYERLGDERERIDRLLDDATAQIPQDDPVHEQIEWSTGGDESHRATEQFAYLGSQVMPPGGFAPELEEVYARYFLDRAELVEQYRRSEAVLDDVIASLEQAQEVLGAAEQEAANARAQYDAERAAYESALAEHEGDRAEFEAAEQARREATSVTATYPDGTQVTLPWGEWLDRRDSELAATRADLDARLPDLEAQEADLVPQRAEVDALRADVEALLAAARPGG